MGHADALSRNHYIAAITEDEVALHIKAVQAHDPVVSELCSRLEESPVEPFDLKYGLVYRKNPDNRLALYVPPEMESNIIRLIHEKIGSLLVSVNAKESSVIHKELYQVHHALFPTSY